MDYSFHPIKLKFRQFWNAKLLWSTLSDENKALNMPVGSVINLVLMENLWKSAP
jgi:hypothetical protein